MKRTEQEMTSPRPADILALHGRSFALLTLEEREIFEFFAARGRKYGVRLAVLKRTTAEELLAARSREEAEELLCRADGVIEVEWREVRREGAPGASSSGETREPNND
jgi:hypothetical protein